MGSTAALPDSRKSPNVVSLSDSGSKVIATEHATLVLHACPGEYRPICRVGQRQRETSGVSEGIRAAGRGDVDCVVRLVADAYQPYVGRIGRRPAPLDADYEALVAAGKVWVATRCGDLVGVMVLEQRADHLFIENVAVAPSAQGEGIGGQLLAFAEDQARAAGLRGLRLYTNERMVENLAYYPRRGFAETHRASSEGFARVYFTKTLPASPSGGRRSAAGGVATASGEPKMVESFEVGELTARRVCEADLEGMCRLDSDPETMATLGGPRPTEVTASHLRYDLDQWSTRGYGMYTLVTDAGEVAGRVGLRSAALLDRAEIEVGYSLLPRWWGRGIATAAVRQLAALAAHATLANSIVATVEERNAASVRVLEKASFTYERDLERAGEVMSLYRRPLSLAARGEGPGTITADGCAVDLYASLPPDDRVGLIHARIPEKATVLDLGCGAGALAEPLSALGHPVTGVDNSPEMLAHLHQAEGVLADIASLDLARRFDVVVLASNLVNQPDPLARSQLLRVGAAHLESGGRLLLEWMPPSRFGRWVAGRSHPGSIGEVATELTVHAYDGELLSATITYDLDERRWSQHFTVRRLELDALESDLRDAGLRLREQFGPTGTWLEAIPAVQRP